MSNEKRETGRGGDQPMVKVKKGNAASPLLILRWPLLALANLILVLAFQVLFIHTHAAPLTAESLARLPYFAGCEVLDSTTPFLPEDTYMGANDSDWLLYRNGSGEVHAVRIEWNLLLPRFKIEKQTDEVIPAGETYTFTEKDFLGTNEVAVENQAKFTQFAKTGGCRDQFTISAVFIFWVLGLLLAESAVKYLIEKKLLLRK